MSTMNSTFDGKRCPSCSKTVYRVEEILCSGCPWHKECFKCGGIGDLGCQRKLNLSDFTSHFAAPYCKVCYMRLINKPATSTDEAAAAAVAASSGSNNASRGGSERTENVNGSGKVPERNPSVVVAPSRASVIISNPLNTGRLACPKCTKTVYKAEEIQLAGFSWHKSCFTCGGASETDGCKRTLNAQDVRPHRGIPFCKGCIGKQPILDKKKNDSAIARTDTESSESTAQDTAVDDAESSRITKAAELRGSASTTAETISRAGGISKVDTAATSTSGGTTASTAPNTPSAIGVTTARVVSVDGRVKDGDSEDMDDDEETTYQDDDGVPCTRTGQPLSGSSSNILNSDPTTPGGSVPVKRVTKMKKLFKTVFGRSNKKLPVDAPAEAFVEGPLEQTVDSSFDVQSPVEASGEISRDAPFTP